MIPRKKGSLPDTNKVRLSAQRTLLSTLGALPSARRWSRVARQWATSKPLSANGP